MPSEDVEEIRKKRKRKKKKEQTLSTSWVISSLNPCITVANLSILGPLWKSTTLCADCWLVCLAVGVDLLLRVLVTTGDPRHSTPTTWLHSYIKWDELVVRSSPCFQVQPFASVAEGLTTILAVFAGRILLADLAHHIVWISMTLVWRWRQSGGNQHGRDKVVDG